MYRSALKYPGEAFLVPLGSGVKWGGTSECFDCLGQEKDRVSVNMAVKQGWAPRLLFGARAAGVYLRSDSRHLVFQSSRAVSTQKDGPELVPRRTLIGSSTFLARDVRCRVHLTRSQNEPHPESNCPKSHWTGYTKPCCCNQ